MDVVGKSVAIIIDLICFFIAAELIKSGFALISPDEFFQILVVNVGPRIDDGDNDIFWFVNFKNVFVNGRVVFLCL